ncbi:hypothetical protein HYE82_28630 [Streptomyces sp. BR123]|uniref:hypothetical protein n=1 Tax=Streptomyces sp. BR123 TaxID=2749828 RepID=UPI0015C4D6E4|nr:hypothetical protein [Streptomyces sp. BR123]NXY98266.1 hypothetical protein [Streptomyces sp. BR123]
MDPHTEAPPAPLPDSVALPRPAEEPSADDTHTADTTERGSFCLAVCTCGWRGPARRSRDLARKDAAGHTAG